LLIDTGEKAPLDKEIILLNDYNKK
jgi:hypothetical protein